MRWLIIIWLLLVVFQQQAELERASEPFQSPPSFHPYNCMKHDTRTNLWFPCRDSDIPNGDV
jgi:hypothetical protein